MDPAEFRREAEQLKAQLARLHDRMREADATGRKQVALDLMSEMLDLQREFFSRWKTATPPVLEGMKPRL